MAYSYRPHVVQLDIGLLEIDGFDVARHLCRDQKTKDVSLIAMTGYGKERHHQASGEAGFSRHLVKPVNPIQLLEFLAEILPRSDAAPV